MRPIDSLVLTEAQYRCFLQQCQESERPALIPETVMEQLGIRIWIAGSEHDRDEMAITLTEQGKSVAIVAGHPHEKFQVLSHPILSPAFAVGRLQVPITDETPFRVPVQESWKR